MLEVALRYLIYAVRFVKKLGLFKRNFDTKPAIAFGVYHHVKSRNFNDFYLCVLNRNFARNRNEQFPFSRT